MELTLNLSEEELRIFLEETEEQIQVLEEGFLTLERDGIDPETVAAIFRAAHTVKGSSATIGHQQMAALTHVLENVLDLMRAGRLVPGPRVTDVLLRSLDQLRALKQSLVDGSGPAAGLNDVLQELRAIAANPEGCGDASPGEAGDPQGDLPPHVWERIRYGLSEGLVPLQVNLSLAPDSIMPAVRGYQAFLALSRQGEVIHSVPSLEDIEAERSGTELCFWLLTGEARESVRNAATSVTDILKVDIARLAEDGLPPETHGAEATGGGAPAAAAPAPDQEAATRSAATASTTTPAGAHPAASGREAAPAGADSRTVRVDVSILDNLMNLVGELVIDRTRLGRLSAQLGLVHGVEELATDVGRISNHLARLTAFLQEEILKARMLPIDRLFKKFPRMVRDLSHRFGKEIDFVVKGEDTELDRSVIEVIGDPLMHLLRNSVDHGLETPEERRKVGKPDAGRVVLAAYYRDNQIVLEVSDDGRGMDPARLREVAISKGVLTPERAAEISDREALFLIFAAGFSTAKEVTDVSGRGVGLDVVRRNIEQLNGRLDLESEVGKGTNFRIYLPLTLATIRALLVRSAGQTFALPLSAVVETLRLSPGDIQTMRLQEVVVVRDKVVPIHRLDACLGQVAPGDQAESDQLYAVLVNSGGSEVGLIVDALVGEQEIVIKNLGRFIGEVPGIAGATVLGDGSLALILEVRGLRGVSLSAKAPALATV